MRTVITVDETRETISFFGSTAAVEGWRVCIVDTVDELNPNAANALLKILEEPPQQSLFLLVSHATGAGIADHPVALPQTAAAGAFDRRRHPRRGRAPAIIAADDPALVEAAAAAEGSVARALTLLGGDALKLQQRTAALLATLPQVDPRELHALGDSLGDQRPRGAGRLHRRRRALGLRSACTPTRPMPMRTCPALHGWRRYGKRSPAPRATPQSIIWNENRWFSRCFRSLRKRRGKRRASQSACNQRLNDKGIRGGQKKSSKKKKTKKTAAAASKKRVKKAAAKKRARSVAKKPQAKKVPRKREESDAEESCEEGCQEVGQESQRRKPRPSKRAAPRRKQSEGRSGAEAGAPKPSGTEAGIAPTRKARAAVAAPRRASRGQHLLHHDRDRLSERRAAYRPRL